MNGVILRLQFFFSFLYVLNISFYFLIENNCRANNVTRALRSEKNMPHAVPRRAVHLQLFMVFESGEKNSKPNELKNIGEMKKKKNPL